MNALPPSAAIWSSKRILPVALCLIVFAAAASSGTVPQSRKDIVSTAIAAGNLKTLAAALKAADLVDTLKGTGPFTVFAPTDEAFAKLPAGTVAELLKPANRARLVSVLTYHVVPGRVTAREVVKLREAKTVNGEKVRIVARGGRVMVDQAKIIQTDIACSNGVIHVIDSVIIPY